MTEAFLHYIWKYKLFNSPELHTKSGEQIIIHHSGTHNYGGGPDFLNARIRIGETMWAGHVEIHLHASDWHAHKHTDDVHYKNVVLHVVFDNDKEIHLHNPGDLQVLDLSGYIPQGQWNQYEHWLHSKSWIPCQAQLPGIDMITWTNWKDRLLMERLEIKCKAVYEQLHKVNGDWSESFYRLLARNFGFKVNSDAMEMLAESLPQSILAKHKSDPFQIEALLFGQSGLLMQIFSDEYPNDLKKEYEFLQKKYTLKTMNAAAWNFGRMRPSNFPTIRIAQFAALICKSEHLFSALLETEWPNDIRKLFATEAHEYWNHNFRFDARTEDADMNKERNAKRIGDSSLNNILINTVAVVLFAYGRHCGNENLTERALRLLETVEAEYNAIISNWQLLGVNSTHAADTQSLIHLYNNYCSEKKCLTCAVGLKALGR
ncbi:MAG: DUF2851 family protein [Flavobacteriales bacterium]